MEDETETERVDEYEKDKQAQERGSSFLYPATDSLQTFKSLKNNALLAGRGFTVCLYLL